MPKVPPQTALLAQFAPSPAEKVPAVALVAEALPPAVVAPAVVASAVVAPAVVAPAVVAQVAEPAAGMVAEAVQAYL